MGTYAILGSVTIDLIWIAILIIPFILSIKRKQWNWFLGLILSLIAFWNTLVIMTMIVPIIYLIVNRKRKCEAKENGKKNIAFSTRPRS